MELSADFLQGLQLLENPANIDDASFDLVLRLAVDSILSTKTIQGLGPTYSHVLK